MPILDTLLAMARRSMRNLALVGFMGTGKSTVGLVVARALEYELLDTDKMIEEKSGKTIEEIFAEDGEQQFREWERTVVEQLSNFSRAVISTGGGLLTNPDNFQSLKKHSMIICLWASPETIWKRVRLQKHRPLLRTTEPLQKIRQLLRARERFYRQADALVNTDGRPTRGVAQQVLQHYRLAQTGANA